MKTFIETEGRARDRETLLALVTQLAHRERLLAERIDQAQELADGIALALADLREELAGTGQAQRPMRLPARRREEADGDSLRRTAESGVSSLELRPAPDGMVRVRIDAGKVFALPPVLADLLAILAADGGGSEDEFVPWRDPHQVGRLLAGKTGHPVTRHGLNQAIYRLRRELLRRGSVNPYLIQSNRRRGLRFALRRAVPVIDGDAR